MTEYKKGDRVRVTIEGEVVGAGNASVRVLTQSGQLVSSSAHVRMNEAGVTIEKLADPEPTWVNGDVIEVRGYVPMHRLGANWYNRAAEVHFLSGQPMQISKAWRLGEVTILYKADQPDGSSAVGKADAEPEVQKKVA